jgi:DNA-binding IclR family transcriptional regulator
MPINPSPAVLRAGDLLWELARHPSESFSVSELARMTGVPRATCDSILQALAQRGLVTRREAPLRYELGAACVALGEAARAANSVLRAASAEAEELARTLKACVAVCTRLGDEAHVVAVFNHGPPLGLQVRVAQSIAVVPPFGAVFVAWNSDDVDRWLAQVDQDDRDRYRRALEAVRLRGYSVSVAAPRRPALVKALDTLINSPGSEEARRTRDGLINEMQHGEYLATDIDEHATSRLTQLSAAIFDRGGNASAALMLIAPQYELTASEVNVLGQHVSQAAARATATVRSGVASSA